MPRCSKCGYYSDKRCNLERHEKTHSKGSTRILQKKTYDCQLCCDSVGSREELMNHFTSVHDVEISKKHLKFDSESSFLSWKAQVEKDSSSRFVQHRGVKQSKSNKTAHYYCHREGFFSSEGTGKRRLKLIGSNKINSLCPARIKATTDIHSGSVDVEFVETHFGHQQELGRLHLSKDERREIASKIAAGVPFKEILKAVKKSDQSKDVKFIHLLTSKDLWNIQQEFNLKNESVRLPNDASDSLVMENQGCQVVLSQNDSGSVSGLVIEEQNDGSQDTILEEVSHFESDLEEMSDWEELSVLEEVSQERGNRTLFESRKKEIINEFRAAVEFARSMDDLDLCENAVSQLIFTMEAARSTSGVFAPKRKIDALDEMSQKDVFSSKNKKKKPEPLLRKPSAGDKLKRTNSSLLRNCNQFVTASSFE